MEAFFTVSERCACGANIYLSGNAEMVGNELHLWREHHYCTVRGSRVRAAVAEAGLAWEPIKAEGLTGAHG